MRAKKKANIYLDIIPSLVLPLSLNDDSIAIKLKDTTKQPSLIGSLRIQWAYGHNTQPDRIFGPVVRILRPGVAPTIDYCLLRLYGQR